MQAAGDAVANSNSSSSSSSAVNNSHIDVTGEASIRRPHQVGVLHPEYTTLSTTKAGLPVCHQSAISIALAGLPALVGCGHTTHCGLRETTGHPSQPRHPICPKIVVSLVTGYNGLSSQKSAIAKKECRTLPQTYPPGQFPRQFISHLGHLKTRLYTPDHNRPTRRGCF